MACRITSVLVLLSTASSFTIPIASRSATTAVLTHPTTLQSTLIDETSSSTTTTTTSSTSSETTTTKKKKGPTRFDRLKETYKGFRPSQANKVVAIDDDPIVSFTYDDFAKAVDDTTYSFERNSVVSGVAVEYSSSNGGGCLVDIGAKASAFLPQAEAALVMPESLTAEQALAQVVPLDTPLEFQIISEEDENGQLLVSIKRLQYKQAWDKVTELAAADAVVDAPVVAVNRGGAICMVAGLRAFLPGSHLAGVLPDDNLVGTTLPVKFLEVNTETNKLVVSNRKAVVEQQMADLSRGDLVTGVIKALKPYGAFVQVGGMSGLLHISQISYDRIDDLEKVLQVGMTIKCMIVDHDRINGRIALSTKTLEAEPGNMLRNPQDVFDNAEENARRHLLKMENDRLVREATAMTIVRGLGDSLDMLDDNEGNDSDNAMDDDDDVSDSLDSLLAENNNN